MISRPEELGALARGLLACSLLAAGLGLASGPAHAQTGQDGCFFGECPEDRPPVQRRQPREPEPYPEPYPDPQQQPYPDVVPQPAAPQVARVCTTHLGSCWMAVPIPLGTSCYCPTAYGPVWGIGQ